MSHEIHENDVVQLGSNKPAWWGFQQGHLWEGLLSPMRCFVEGTGAREMWTTPCMTPDGLEVPDKKIVVGKYSNGNIAALSVVGHKYSVLNDQTFFEILDKVYQGRAVVETAGTLHNGRWIWCLVRRDGYSVRGNDKVETFDLWVNRHDGSGCWELHRTHVRVVCANTFNMAVGNGRDRVIGVAHTPNMPSMIDAALRVLDRAQDREREEVKKLVRMTEIRMRFDEASVAFDTLLGIDRAKPDVSPKASNQHAELLNLFERGTGNKGETRFDAFNAVTEYVDHSRTVRQTSGRSVNEARFISSLLGTGDALKARAFELLAVD